MFEHKSRGFIVFTVSAGVVEDEALELIRNKNRVVQVMTAIIDNAKKQDPYANPESPYFDTDCALGYEEKYAQARNLCSVALNDEDDLKIIEIFETIPIPFYVSWFRGIVILFNTLSGRMEHALSRMSRLCRFRR